MIKTYDIGLYIKPALKLRMYLFACNAVIRLTNTNIYAAVQCFDGPPETAVPVLKLYYQRTEIQQAAGEGDSSTKVVLPENEKSSRPPEKAIPVLKLYYQRTKKSSRPPETAVPVLKLYYKRTNIQPAAGDGGSNTEVVPPENENPAGRRRRRFQC